MVAHVCRASLPEASFGAVDRAMRALGLAGVRRDTRVRTTVPAKDGKRAGDLLDRAACGADAGRPTRKRSLATGDSKR